MCFEVMDTTAFLVSVTTNLTQRTNSCQKKYYVCFIPGDYTQTSKTTLFYTNQIANSDKMYPGYGHYHFFFNCHFPDT